MREMLVGALFILIAIAQAEECTDGYFISKEERRCIDCTCGNIGSIDNICDKQSGKCNCKPGFLGYRCDSQKCTAPCYEIILHDFQKIYDDLIQLRSIEGDIVNNFNTSVLDSIKRELEHLENNIIKLNSFMKAINLVDANLLTNLENPCKHLQKEIHTLTKMYNLDADHQKIMDKLSNGLKRIDAIGKKIDGLYEELQMVVKTIEDQEQIDKILKESAISLDDISNITTILGSKINYVNTTCLEIVDFVCANKQTGELDRIKSEITLIDTKTIGNRINWMQNNSEKNIRENERVSKKIDEIMFVPLPKFNTERYDANHNKSIETKNSLYAIDSLDNKANNHLNSAIDALHRVNISKAEAYNMIIIAPVQEIRQKIGEVLDSSKRRKKLDQILANMTLADNKLKQINVSLKSIIEQRNRIILEIESNMHLVLRHEGDMKLLQLIKRLQTKVSDIDKYYATQLEDWRSTHQGMEAESEEIERIVHEEIKCMENESNDIDQELMRANMEMSKLDEELNRAENALIMLNEAEDVAKEIRKLETAMRELKEISANATTLCPVYDLNR